MDGLNTASNAPAASDIVIVETGAEAPDGSSDAATGRRLLRIALVHRLHIGGHLLGTASFSHRWVSKKRIWTAAKTCKDTRTFVSSSQNESVPTNAVRAVLPSESSIPWSAITAKGAAVFWIDQNDIGRRCERSVRQLLNSGGRRDGQQQSVLSRQFDSRSETTHAVRQSLLYVHVFRRVGMVVRMPRHEQIINEVLPGCRSVLLRLGQWMVVRLRQRVNTCGARICVQNCSILKSFTGRPQSARCRRYRE